MQNNRGFTVLELMVGIVVFTLGFLGAYMLVESASNASLRSRDEIIGANIMREQIELLKNLRDTNWIQFKSWDSIKLARSSGELDDTFLSGSYYTIANDFAVGKTTQVKKLSGISLSQADITADFNSTSPAPQTRLCIDSLGRYTHNCAGNQKTNYASFLQIQPLITKNTSTHIAIPVERAYKVTVFFASFTK